MSDRRLVAAFACRAGGTRLYAKPLQNLGGGRTILDHLLEGAKATPEIDEIVLGVAEGVENFAFMDAARRHGLNFIVGSEKDVLWRLIQCGRAGAATDVFRVTTECPFPAWEYVAEAWRKHVHDDNDITVSEFLPEGCNFEIYRLDALERSHREGEDKERSEYCSAYPRRRHDLFRIGLVCPPQSRLDLRLTVDNPEDLMVCRAVYEALRDKGPRIPMADIFSYLDANPGLTALLAPYIDPRPTWAHVQTASAQ